MITIGIIGFGGIVKSPLHAGAILNCPDYKLKAAADVMPDNGSAKEWGITDYYTDYRELLKDPEIDAVLIATPHHLHEEHAVAAFNAGKHVLIEKPISRNLKEAKNILDAAKKSGKIGMIGFCQRFHPMHADMKKRIDEGQIGKPLSARIDHYQNFRPAPSSWWLDADKVGGGAVIGSGVHRLDILRWVLGEVVKVHAVGLNVPQRMSAETCVHAVLEFESGAIANFSINWASYNYLYCEGFSVSGENGLIVAQECPFLYKVGTTDIENGVLKEVTPPVCQGMYEHFADCIKNNKTPDPSLEEGYKTLQLVRAIYKSLETGEIVTVADVDF